MKTICILTTVHPRYDIRIFVKEAHVLKNLGFNVFLLVADDKPNEVIDGISIISLGKPKNRIDRLISFKNKVCKQLELIKPDFVHFHDPEILLLVNRLSKSYKVIYDVHEDLPKQVLSKHYIPKFIRPLVSFIVELIERYSSRKLFGVVAATDIIASRFQEYNKHVISLYNYPLLSELNIITTSWKQRENALCYIGSISKTRGIIPLIESLNISKIKLYLAGPLSGITLEELKLINGFEFVEYLGVIDRNEVTLLLSKVKIGVVTLLPTPSYVESLPIKMFEYMVSGLAVIASDFPLWRELMHDNGVFVNPSSANDIAQATIKLFKDDDTLETMSTQGREIALANYVFENQINKLKEFYK